MRRSLTVFPTVKNLWSATTFSSPNHHLPSCYDATASKSNRNSFESNRIGFVISRIAHLYYVHACGIYMRYTVCYLSWFDLLFCIIVN